MKNLGEFAKKTLQSYVGEVDKKLENYWDSELDLNFGFNDRQKELVRKMLLHAKEHNLRASKRLRGSLVRYGYLLGGKELTKEVEKAELGIELVHTALLMHDDFMDQDKIRRGKPTTQEYFGGGHYGNTMAVNLGDAVLCMGFGLIKNEQALSQLHRGITNTAWGQAYDLSLNEYSEEDVIALHRAKTAIYTYENPLFIGAHLAGLPKEAFEILHEYSMDGGVAFQLQDDILGVFGDEEKTGKSSNSDLLQKKCTLLVRGINLDNPNLDEIKKEIKDSGKYEYSKKIAREYAERATKSAEKLRKLDLNKEAIDYIQGIAEYMVTREV